MFNLACSFKNMRALFLLVAALSILPACDSAIDDRIIEGVDFDVLFAPPTQVEIAMLLDSWSARDVSPQGVSVVLTDSLVSPTDTTRLFQATIYAHTVAGVQHYGLVLVPDGATGKLPVVVYAHGGDGGVRAAEAAGLAGLFSQTGRDYVWVVPSFRAEPLRFGEIVFESEGPASPWDYDVDDALALLNVALQQTPQADESRIGVVGISRGGDVALLMAIRDPRIDRVLDLFGPTDFFGPYVQDIVADALQGGTRQLPGFDVLNARFVQPLKVGTLTTPQMRLELLRRSPVYFTGRLPTVQVQHGTADNVVDISQSRRLAEVMQGRTDFRFFEWEGGQHNPATFPLNWLFEAQDFLAAL